MIIPYHDANHRAEVLKLWRDVFGSARAHNEPALVIDKKLAGKDQLFWVVLESGILVGTMMAGYHGHRGWLYSLAVAESSRGRGLGRALGMHAEKTLQDLGGMKINLQIRAGNEGVESFYHQLGFPTAKCVSLGKTLLSNDED